jgi:regulator of protease activity HflC (stomatin/prohibitin superfamily)
MTEAAPWRARVPERHAGIVERMGRFVRSLPPGRHPLVPVLEQLRAVVDLREQVLEVEVERARTADGAAVRIGAVVRFTVADPVAATYEVPDLRRAVEDVAAEALRAAVGELGLESALGSRWSTAQSLLQSLVEVTAPWGIRIDGASVEGVDVMDRGTAVVDDKEKSWLD